MLYERLEQSINQGKDDKDISNIIHFLNIRMGSFGAERKNIINNLCKHMIDIACPNFVKYLFWGSSENKGIFEDLNLT